MRVSMSGPLSAIAQSLERLSSVYAHNGKDPEIEINLQVRSEGNGHVNQSCQATICLAGRKGHTPSCAQATSSLRFRESAVCRLHV